MCDFGELRELFHRMANGAHEYRLVVFVDGYFGGGGAGIDYEIGHI